MLRRMNIDLSKPIQLCDVCSAASVAMGRVRAPKLAGILVALRDRPGPASAPR